MSATHHRSSSRANASSSSTSSSPSSPSSPSTSSTSKPASTSPSAYLSRHSIAVVEISPESAVLNHTTLMTNVLHALLCIDLSARIVPNLDLLCPRCTARSESAEGTDETLAPQTLPSWESFAQFNASTAKVMTTRKHKRKSGISAVVFIPSTDAVTPGFLVFVFSRALNEYQMLSRLSTLQFSHTEQDALEAPQASRLLSPILRLSSREKVLKDINPAVKVALKKFQAGHVVRHNVSLHSSNEPFTCVERVSFIYQQKRGTPNASAKGGAPGAGSSDFHFCVPHKLPFKVWDDILSDQSSLAVATPLWQAISAMTIVYARAYAQTVLKSGPRFRDIQFSVRNLLQLPENKFRLAVLKSFQQFFGLHTLLWHDIPNFATVEGMSDAEIRYWILTRLEYCFLSCYAPDKNLFFPTHRELCVLLQRTAAKEEDAQNAQPSQTPQPPKSPQQPKAPKPSKKKITRALVEVATVGVLATTLSGCSVLTGLDAASSFSCPREDGFSCASMQETYRHADAMPTSEPKTFALASSTSEKEVAAQANASETVTVEKTVEHPVASDTGSTNVTTSEKTTTVTVAPNAKAPSTADAQRLAADRLQRSSLPRRVPERFVTIGFAPWSDADGDLHDAHTVIMRLSEAHWSSAAAPTEKKNSAVVHLPFEGVRKNGVRAVAPKAPAMTAPTPQSVESTPSTTLPAVLQGAANTQSVSAATQEPSSDALRQMRAQFAAAIAEQEARNVQTAPSGEVVGVTSTTPAAVSSPVEGE